MGSARADALRGGEAARGGGRAEEDALGKVGV